MARIVCTEKELVSNLKALAKGNPPSSYRNSPPWNLLYWDGSRWWADCVNLYKALFNGRSIKNPTPGSFQADLSNTGDVTEWGLLSQCTDISTDFSKLGNQFRCLYKAGHFGGYLGMEWDEPGQGIVNSVESTPAWEDGIQYSYVDKKGNRYWAKGKQPLGAWTHHGLATKWIDYSSGSDKVTKPVIGKPMSKAQCQKYWTSSFSPTLSKVKKLAKQAGFDSYEIIAYIGWVQGEGYWEDAVKDPYLAYLSACVMANNIKENWYGRTGKEVVKRIASWGDYYAYSKQKARYKAASKKALKAAYWALRYPQTGIHCCYGPGYKPSNCFYDPKFKAQGENVYVW